MERHKQVLEDVSLVTCEDKGESFKDQDAIKMRINPAAFLVIVPGILLLVFQTVANHANLCLI